MNRWYSALSQLAVVVFVLVDDDTIDGSFESLFPFNSLAVNSPELRDSLPK